MNHRGRYRAVCAVWIAITASTSAPGAAQAPGGGAAVLTDTLPPSGFGTLRRENISVRLETATLQLTVFPLDEGVIRLLARDSFESLHRLRVSKAQEIADAAAAHGIREPTLFVVTFFGLQDQARFRPEEVNITNQNRFFRPLAVLPLSPLWGDLRVNQRETVTAVFLYENSIDLLEPLTVSYEGTSSDRWSSVLREMERERSRVFSRASGGERP